MSVLECVAYSGRTDRSFLSFFDIECALQLLCEFFFYVSMYFVLDTLSILS